MFQQQDGTDPRRTQDHWHLLVGVGWNASRDTSVSRREGEAGTKCCHFFSLVPDADSPAVFLTASSWLLATLKVLQERLTKSSGERSRLQEHSFVHQESPLVPTQRVRAVVPSAAGTYTVQFARGTPKSMFSSVLAAQDGANGVRPQGASVASAKSFRLCVSLASRAPPLHCVQTVKPRVKC